MTWGDDMAPGDGAAAANAGVETGGLETGARFGVAPVTLAGFITMVSRPCVDVLTGAAGGGI